MNEQENIQIVRKTFDNLNKHNVDVNDQMIAENAKFEATGAPGTMTRDQGRMYVSSFVNAFPDIRFEVKDIIAQGDKVAASWVVKGTHKMPLTTQSGSSIPPTNRSVTVPGCTFYELRNGLITRQEIYWDQVTFLTQLGVVSEQQLLNRNM